MHIGKKIGVFILGFCIPALLVVAYCLNFWFEYSLGQFRQQTLEHEYVGIEQQFTRESRRLLQLARLYVPILEMPSDSLLAGWVEGLQSSNISLFHLHQGKVTALANGKTRVLEQKVPPADMFAALDKEAFGAAVVNGQPLQIGFYRFDDDEALIVTRLLTPVHLQSLGQTNLIQSVTLVPLRQPVSIGQHLKLFSQVPVPTLLDEPFVLQIRQQSDAFERLEWQSLLVVMLLLLGGMLMVAIGYLWLRRGLLKPFDRLMTELKEIDPSARRYTHISGCGGAEFKVLADRINNLLLRIFQQNERSRITLESIAEAVILTNNKAKVIYLNPQAESLLGLRSQQALGRTLDSLLKSDDQLDEELLAFMSSGNRQPEYSKVTLQMQQPRIMERAVSNLCNHKGKVIGAVTVLRDITQEETLKQQLRLKASVDGITGLYNRSAFEERLPGFAEGADTLALCYLDLEQFKLINDNCGHDAGDQMLVMVARAIESCLQGDEMLARLGGDEFGLAVRNRSALEVAKLLKQLVKQVCLQVLPCGGAHYRVGVSSGVAFHRGPCMAPAELLKDADIACLAAKRKGSNQIHFFDDRNKELANERNAPKWAVRIARAIEDKELLLYFQPIKGLNGCCRRQRLEILLRIRDNSGRILPPAQFIAAAERFKLMPEVDREVIRKAFLWLSEHSQLWSELCVSINLSGNSLGSEGMLDYIAEMQGRYGIPSSCVCFEITETSAIQNRTRAMEMLNQLRRLGFAFALDDFGSGFASYGYLRELPVDYVKIDGCFVRHLASNAKDYAIVKSIHDVCRVMGIETVAEFVENQEIVDKLLEIGVDYAQGYAIGRPKPLEQFYQWQKAHEQQLQGLHLQEEYASLA
ncbi:EAL domain-containing protein [Shewanella indica]|uniref:EAL domain-containing protein n=4 Tax=Shewanella indica TaxID=768528 RepID=A0ABU4QDE1_9GAMM|nr:MULTISPECIES: EAL domain-containing protein [Shewanella]OIN15461.1 diguanylate cyclase [Shewanella algae]BCV35175.1 cyclic di-GMP phosphodiesterase PdeB [Shewanella chilikensis]MCE9791950.1 EAL domain-containing protein [Shewanella indica]MDX6016598.1 EAL domain-containing protein [Shewanella indica]NDO75693.1 EAL domain-containing protein [Shewanella sp. SE1]